MNLLRENGASTRRRVISLLCSAILTLLFAIPILTGNNPIWGYSGVDGSCFILMGRGILAGKVPYLNMVDNKGLVLYFLNALPQLLGRGMEGAGSTIWVWVLELLFLFGSLRTIAWLARQMNIRADIIPQLFYLSSLVTLIEIGNMSEEYANFFNLLAFAVAFHYTRGKDLWPMHRYGFSLGLLFTLGFFTRPNNALPVAGIILAFGIGLLVQKRFADLLVCGGAAGVGVATVVIPMFLYLGINGALTDWLNQTFLANMQYADDSGNTILQLLDTTYGYIALGLFLLSLTGVAGMLCRGEKSQPSRHFFLWAVALASVLSFYSAFISRFAYRHYLLVGTVPMVVAFMLFIGSTTEDSAVSKRVPLRSAVASPSFYFQFFAFALVAAIALPKGSTILSNLRSFPSTLANYVTADESTYSRQSEMLRLARHIPESERDSVFIVEIGSDATDLYVQMNLLPTKRLFICADRFCRLIPGMAEEFGTYFTEGPPTWVISPGPLEQIEGTAEYAAISERYGFFAQNDYDIYLYQLIK